jgi:hypothetical protein
VQKPEDATSAAQICGRDIDGSVSTDPSKGTIRFPVLLHIAAAEFIQVELERVRLQGTLEGNGYGSLILGGWVTSQQIQDVYLPAFVDFVNRRIQTHPAAGTAEFARIADGKCVSTIEGCESVVNYQGECKESEPPFLTLTEVRCNLLLSGAFARDIDIDGDGEDDLLSVGVQLDLVPVTIVE